jgi:hypothetical protein
MELHNRCWDPGGDAFCAHSRTLGKGPYRWWIWKRRGLEWTLGDGNGVGGNHLSVSRSMIACLALGNILGFCPSIFFWIGDLSLHGKMWNILLSMRIYLCVQHLHVHVLLHAVANARTSRQVAEISWCTPVDHYVLLLVIHKIPIYKVWSRFCYKMSWFILW